jgi:hypothetical protein
MKINLTLILLVLAICGCSESVQKETGLENGSFWLICYNSDSTFSGAKVSLSENQGIIHFGLKEKLTLEYKFIEGAIDYEIKDSSGRTVTSSRKSLPQHHGVIMSSRNFLVLTIDPNLKLKF